MAKNIVNLKIDGTSYSARPYGTCTTAAGTAAKAVTCADFSLTTGATILVKFTYANSVASPTLNVNSTGAKPIYYRGAALGSSLYYWGANDTVEFYYNGTQWDLMDVGNTNSTYANYSFGNGYATCATAEATTAKVATYQYYSLATGGIVAVKFTYAVPANATLNINSKGAKSIYYNNAAITAGVIGAGDIATFVYDGTNYVLLAVDNIMTVAEKTKLSGIATGATANKGTVTSVATGVGLTGGSITTSGTIKCNLNSETSLGTIGSTSKLYAVGVDANKKLCVKVPWTDTIYTLPTATDTTLGGVNKGYTIPYIVGSSSDSAGVWTGSCDGITSYKDGLTIIYVPQQSGIRSGTTLNINGLGAKACYINNNKMTTHFSANIPILLTYITQSGVGYWKHADYTDGNAYTSAYCTTSGGTAAKTASLSNYILTSKTYTFISISNANTVQGAITLNINSKGAKPIYINGSASSASNYTLPAGTYVVYYDGTNYYFRTDGKLPGVSNYSLPAATSSTLGGVKIGSNISVSSGTISLTKSNVTSALGYTPPTTNTTYGLANFESNGLMSATTFTTMSEDSAISNLTNISFETDPLGDKVSVYAKQGVTYVYYTRGENDYIESGVVGTIDIPAATTTKAGVMSAADKTKLNGIATGANKYTLPNATSSTLGGVKIGSNISVSNGTISLSKSNVTSALGYTPIGPNTAVGNLTGNSFTATDSTGYSAVITSDNIYLTGNDAEVEIKVSGITAPKFITAGGTSSQFVRGNGNCTALTKSEVTTALGYTPPTTNTTYGVATTSTNGLMSAADKRKLNNLGTNLGVTKDNDFDLIGDYYDNVDFASYVDLTNGYWIDGDYVPFTEDCMYFMEAEEDNFKCFVTFIYRASGCVLVGIVNTGSMKASISKTTLTITGTDGVGTFKIRPIKLM